jgi:hypothetical protein
MLRSPLLFDLPPSCPGGDAGTIEKSLELRGEE